jgi:hypothetical protein
MVCDMAAKVSFETSTGPGAKSLGDGMAVMELGTSNIERSTSNVEVKMKRFMKEED